MLKSKVAAVLSLSGILVSGSAAALVNTQVLASETKSSAPVTATLAGASTSTTSTSSTPTQTPPTLTSTQATYQVGGAGVVVLDTAGDVLSVVSATPGTDWTFVKAENYGPNAVEVKFRDATTEVEFKATLLVGVVSTSIESELINDDDDDDNVTPGSSVPSSTIPGSTSTTIDDDDDDEDHDDDHGSKSGKSWDDDDHEDDHGGDDHRGDDSGHDGDDD